MAIRYRPQMWKTGAWRNFQNAYSFGVKKLARKQLVFVKKAYKKAGIRINRLRVLKYNSSK